MTRSLDWAAIIKQQKGFKQTQYRSSAVLGVVNSNFGSFVLLFKAGC